MKNRSPKGNMWSAMPVALLCRVLIGMSVRVAAPKGTKSCRTQGTCLFVQLFVRPSAPPQAISGLKSALSGLKSALSGLKSTLSGLESGRADFRPERTGFRSDKAKFRPKRTDSRPERADFRPERADSRPERADFRSERAWGGQTNKRTDGQTNKSPLCSTGLRPLRGLPKKAENPVKEPKT